MLFSLPVVCLFFPKKSKILSSLERAGAVRNERRARLGNTVREGEAELGNKQLLDVWPADVRRLLDLLHAEDLQYSYNIP